MEIEKEQGKAYIMVKRTLLKKTKYGMLTLALLTISPVIFLPTLHASEQTKSAEQELFASLRKFLFSTRNLDGKRWMNWCDEWIKILGELPDYSALKEDLSKVRKWRNPTSIALRLDKALGAYYSLLPEDIVQRAKELDQKGMVELIEASVAGRNPNVPETQINIDEQAE